MLSSFSSDFLTHNVLQGHFDGVIKQYRETHVTSWPEDIPEVVPLLQRLGTIHPHQDTQTHIIHLASDGVILVSNLGPFR